MNKQIQMEPFSVPKNLRVNSLELRSFDNGTIGPVETSQESTDITPVWTFPPKKKKKREKNDFTEDR